MKNEDALMRTGSCVCMRHAEGDERGDDAGNAVAHEGPRDSLSGFHSGVKHCHDGHNAGGDATFGSPKQEA